MDDREKEHLFETAARTIWFMFGAVVAGVAVAILCSDATEHSFFLQALSIFLVVVAAGIILSAVIRD